MLHVKQHFAFLSWLRHEGLFQIICLLDFCKNLIYAFLKIELEMIFTKCFLKAVSLQDFLFFLKLLPQRKWLANASLTFWLGFFCEIKYGKTSSNKAYWRRRKFFFCFENLFAGQAAWPCFGRSSASKRVDWVRRLELPSLRQI